VGGSVRAAPVTLHDQTQAIAVLGAEKAIFASLPVTNLPQHVFDFGDVLICPTLGGGEGDVFGVDMERGVGGVGEDEYPLVRRVGDFNAIN
jgi:hypothetical protein